MTLNDDESLVLDFRSVAQHIRRNVGWVVGFTVGAVMLATVYVLLIYQPIYRSDATILFNPNNTPPVISDIGEANNLLNADNMRINPFKSQEQLLSSKLLAQKVIHDLKKDGWNITENPEAFMSTVLEASHLRETDFIRLSAKASTPKHAQKIAQVYLKNYQKLMRELSYNPLLEKKALFEGQITETNTELDAMKEEFQAYQEAHGIVDIATENELKVTQLERTRTSIKETEARLSEVRAEVNSILNQLKLQPTEVNTAIQSVARGQNSILTGLYAQLYEKESEVDRQALIYAPTNPDLIRLKKEVAVINKQIDEHNVLTVGNPIEAKSVLIKDGLRLDMVNRLVKSQAEQNALSHKLNTLKYQRGDLSDELKSLPKNQLDYARLKSAIDNKEKLLGRLQDKLSEIKIHLAGIQKNLVVIDPPSLPDKSESMNKVQLVVGSGLAALFIAILTLTFMGFIKNSQLSAETLEKLFNAPVLSVIPTTIRKGKKTFGTRPNLNLLKKNSVINSMVEAYQNLAVNLKVQGDITAKNVLTVAALKPDGEQSIMLSNLGLCLAQAGESTVLIDANLRQPELHEVFDHKLDYDKGIVELINNVSECLFKNATATNETLLPIVERGLTPSGIHQGLFYLNAGFALENPFEFLNSKGLHKLIAALRENFDWVLVNAPPLTHNPELSAVLRHTDGLILVTNEDLSESQAYYLQQRIQKLNSSVVGLVVQE